MNFITQLIQFMVLLPSAVLCFLPMKNQLLIPIKRIILYLGVTLAVMIPLSAAIIAACSLPANYIMLPDIIILYIFYQHVLRTRWTTNAAVFLLVTALMTFPTNLSLCIDSQIHPAESAFTGCPVACIFQLAASMIILLIYCRVFYKYFSNLINSLDSAYVWGATLPVPLIFTILNIIIMPEKYETLQVNRMFFIYVIYLILSFFLLNVIYVIFYLVAVILLKNTKTEERVRLFEMQESQYTAQQRYITESAKQRHDFRQQLHSLAQMAQNKEYEALTKHLEDCVAAIPESPMQYCSKIPVNALLNYYDALFASHSIVKYWDVQIPAKCTISDTELCSLIGNILENVCTGCLTLEHPADRFHRLTMFSQKNGFLVIKSENRFDGKVNKKNYRYLSTHKGGSGIGLTSIEAIAEKYGGMAYFSNTEEVFTIELIIKILPDTT